MERALKSKQPETDEKVDAHVMPLSGADLMPVPKLPSLSPDQMQSIGIAGMSLTIGVILWHIVTAINLDFYINFENVPSPARVFTAFFGHIQTEIFWTHIYVSMRRILISYSLAVALGISIGLGIVTLTLHGNLG